MSLWLILAALQLTSTHSYALFGFGKSAPQDCFYRLTDKAKKLPASSSLLGPLAKKGTILTQSFDTNRSVDGGQGQRSLQIVDTNTGKVLKSYPCNGTVNTYCFHSPTSFESCALQTGGDPWSFGPLNREE